MSHAIIRGANPKQAAVARERQDLVEEWQKRAALRNVALRRAAAGRCPTKWKTSSGAGTCSS